MNKHTPGPWVATAVSEYKWSIHNANGHPAPHALVIAPNGDLLRRMRSRANARLIAAAPELLAALRAIDESQLNMSATLERQMHAALAKAEGK